MLTKHSLILAFAVAALHSPAGFAQGPTETNQTLYPVTFSATGHFVDSARGHIVTTNINQGSIIAQALGLRPGEPTLARGIALVYNAAEDCLQVVNTNTPGAVVDVLRFGGGTAIQDTNRIDRFTFLFLPGQTNEAGVDTNVIGSALITERAAERANAAAEHAHAGPHISGSLWFVLSGGNVLGSTNYLAATNTNPVTGTNTNTATVASTNAPGTNTNGAGVVAGTTLPGFVMTSSNLVFDPTASICVGTFATTPGHPGFGMPPGMGGGGGHPGTGTGRGHGAGGGH